MTTLEQRGVMRLRHRQHELLASADLVRDVADPTELQWWHNRSVHDAFGVVSGLEVRLLATNEGLLVEVAPGFAYDAYGRPLVLSRPLAVEVQVPRPGALPGGTLLLRTPQGGDWAPPVHVHPHRGWRNPEVCWADGSHVSVRDGVPLSCVISEPLTKLPDLKGSLPDRIGYIEAAGALVTIGRMSAADLEAASTISADSDYAAAVNALHQSSQACPWPRRTRRVGRSRVVSGMTIPRHTAWRPWLIPRMVNVQEWARSSEIPIGFEVRVDTSAAGFAETPRYFAWLQGPLFALQASGDASGGAHWDHVDQVGPGGFTFYMSLVTLAALTAYGLDRDPSGRPLGGTSSDLLRLLRNEPFCVSWLAIGPPEPDVPLPADEPCADDAHRPCADEVTR